MGGRGLGSCTEAAASGGPGAPSVAAACLCLTHQASFSGFSEVLSFLVPCGLLGVTCHNRRLSSCVSAAAEMLSGLRSSGYCHRGPGAECGVWSFLVP